MIRWWKKEQDTAALNISLHMLMINTRGGARLSANLEAQQIERFTGVLAHEACQMAREVCMIQDGVGLS